MPTTKIIQILTVNPEHKVMVLCSDGSVWWMNMGQTVTWLLVTSMNAKGAYV